MNEAFRHLHMSPELACDFFAVFSRMEYALKAAGYAYQGRSAVGASWDRFADDIDDLFDKIRDAEFKTAVDYLLKGPPPRKQVLDNGVITYRDQVVDPAKTKAQQTLLMIRTVRNNLFHGGKHISGTEKELGRNAMLVSSSLIVLQHCMLLHPDVQRHYQQ